MCLFLSLPHSQFYVSFPGSDYLLSIILFQSKTFMLHCFVNQFFKLFLSKAKKCFCAVTYILCCQKTLLCLDLETCLKLFLLCVRSVCCERLSKLKANLLFCPFPGKKIKNQKGAHEKRNSLF